MIKTRLLARTAVAALTAAALLLTLCPAAARAQTAISAGEAKTQRAKGLDDPDFVGKWDFNTPGEFSPWKPLQAAGLFDVQNGMVNVVAKSKRPCIDLAGPYSAAEIDSVEIRIRCTPAEQGASTAASQNAMGGASNRVRALPQLYQGTRLYFTASAKEKFDAAKSIEFPVVCDGEFHVLTVKPADHPSWKGMIQKIRFDIGDYPDHYELDYIYFHRKASPKKAGETKDEKQAAAMVGAIPTESKK